MNKKLAIILGLLLISSCVYAQVEDDDTHAAPEVEEVQVEQEAAEADVQGSFGGQDQQPDPEELLKDESFRERIRNLYVSCIVTSRHKLNNYGEELMGLLKGIQDKQIQQNLYKKMLAEHIYTCALYGTQNPDTPDQIIKSLQDRTFKISDWEVIYMSLDIKKYNDPNYNTQLTDDEQNILKFVDQFDEAMKQQNGGKTGGEAGEEDDDIPFLNQKTYEPKIGSFSLSNLSSTTQLFYFVAIILAFGGIIAYGYKKIEDDGPKIKTKKDKKKN
ncbi:transmembrane protein, putative (macronuclear) [Tetrahymena thermophila SB210]|uniref:Transmembrane protein, putative n=1 Tax=Tetrahymena thermophila (strain SB210) TaxID=312017 RepID=Q23VX9_TETTS|nr:transmembrane protein, putative [Tetrahymena thermophila SB210]EAS00726.1 transmembrane protein, putative [Tetrahymena thermophila SB210]|eukprot:XP_001020971.1 transmembrane protein, putative [Tetrahymena thermophila SB210]